MLSRQWVPVLGVITGAMTGATGCGFFENGFDPKKALPVASKLLFPSENDSRIIAPEEIPEGLFQVGLIRFYYEKKQSAGLISHLLSSQGSPQSSDSFEKDVVFGDAAEPIQSTLNVPLELVADSEHTHFRKRRYYWLQVNQTKEVTWPVDNMYIESTQGQSLPDNFALGQKLARATYQREYSGVKERSVFIQDNPEKILAYYEITSKDSLEVYEITYNRGSFFKSPQIADSERVVLPIDSDLSVIDKVEIPPGEFKISRIRSHFFSQDYRLEGFFDHPVTHLGQPAVGDTVERIVDWGETRTINSIESHLNLPLKLHQTSPGVMFELRQKRHLWQTMDKSNHFAWSHEVMGEESLQGDQFVEVFDEGTKTGRGLYTRSGEGGYKARALIQKISDTEIKIYFQQDASEEKPVIATYELTYKTAP